MYTAENVSIRIKELCTKKKMNIKQLAVVSKMPESTIKNILNGKSKNPGIVTIKKICDGLGITLKEFFSF